jgi:hypothetical protein
MRPEDRRIPHDDRSAVVVGLATDREWSGARVSCAELFQEQRTNKRGRLASAEK